MRVLMVSKACLVGIYQRKLEEMAAEPGLELTVAVPAAWRDERGLLRLERDYVRGYDLVVEPLRFNGSFHLHYYPQLSRLITRIQPDILHLDEEPYNFATWHALRLGRRAGAKTLFFTWQNLLRQYPWPFSRFERDVLCRASAGIAGNDSAVQVWRAKGFAGPMPVIPQFGVDPELFKPNPSKDAPNLRTSFIVGYAGRLVPEKGVDLLLRALAQLDPSVVVRIAGSGPDKTRLRRVARELRLDGRVNFQPLLPSRQMPAFLAGLDCLVLPSRTRPNWKEQFGRILIEAMACGVAVVASDSGELPRVVGDAGLIFPEGDSVALAQHLSALCQQPQLREDFGARGRARVLRLYTQRRVAQATVALYRNVMTDKL